MTRSSTRRKVITCWCASEVTTQKNIRCVLCSKQFHLECHQSLVDSEAAWKCYLCYSENTINKITSLKEIVAEEALAIDHSTECSSLGEQSHSTPESHPTPVASSDSKNLENENPKENSVDSCRRKGRHSCKPNSGTKRGQQVTVKIKKRFISGNCPSTLECFNCSSQGQTDPKLPNETLSERQLLIQTHAPEIKREDRLSPHSGISQQRPLLKSQNHAKKQISPTAAIQKNPKRPKFAYKEPRSDKSTTAEVCTSFLEDAGIPARMRIAQSNLQNDKSGANWNDFGPGLIFLLCEDGCIVHLVFKVAGHSVLRIPLQPDPQNQPVISFEFPSLIIAVHCSQSVWTKHAFTFLQPTMTPALESILFVINRVWNCENSLTDDSTANAHNDPASVQKNLVNYIRSIQNRPQFQAYCNAIQAAIRRQPLL